MLEHYAHAFLNVGAHELMVDEFFGGCMDGLAFDADMSDSRTLRSSTSASSSRRQMMTSIAARRLLPDLCGRSAVRAAGRADWRRARTVFVAVAVGVVRL